MSIRIEHLSKAYGEKKVLKDFCAEIREGSCNVLMGPSGSGKTTLFRILMGFEQPDGGKVAGMPEHISAVFQEDRLCEDFSAIENVAMVLKRGASKSIIEEQLEQIGLSGSLHQPVSQLSGGMRRRVAIVRALLAEGEIVLLDEPFKGLDEVTKETVIRYFKEHTKGRTTLLITHDRQEAEQLGDYRIDISDHI